MKKIVLILIGVCFCCPVFANNQNIVGNAVTPQVLYARQQVNKSILNNDVMMKAVKENDYDVVEACLLAGIQPYKRNYRAPYAYPGESEISVAIMNDDARMVNLFLDYIKLDYRLGYYQYQGFINYSLTNKKRNATLAILTHRRFPIQCLANPNNLRFAIGTNDLVALKILLEKGADPNKNDLIFLSIHSKKYDATKMLLDYGINIEQVLPYGYGFYLKPVNPLFMSINTNQPEMVKLLISYKVKINTSLNGYTPLDYALKKKHGEIATLLILANAKTTSKTLNYAKKLPNNQKILQLLNNKQ